MSSLFRNEERPKERKAQERAQEGLETAGMREYLVVYEHAGGNWSAYAPDLPGCVAAGDTREETARLIREAVEFHLDGMKEEGLDIPEPRAEAERVRVAA